MAKANDLHFLYDCGIRKGLLNAREYYPRQKSLDGYNILISGGNGRGKTTAAAALLMHDIDRRGHDLHNPSLFRFVPDLLTDFQASFDRMESDTEKGLLWELNRPDLLVLDDYGAEIQSRYTQRIFLQILENRLGDRKRTIVTTNLNLAEIPDQRVASRLSQFKRLRMTGPDWRGTK